MSMGASVSTMLESTLGAMIIAPATFGNWKGAVTLVSLAHSMKTARRRTERRHLARTHAARLARGPRSQGGEKDPPRR